MYRLVHERIWWVSLRFLGVQAWTGSVEGSEYVRELGSAAVESSRVKCTGFWPHTLRASHPVQMPSYVLWPRWDIQTQQYKLLGLGNTFFCQENTQWVSPDKMSVMWFITKWEFIWLVFCCCGRKLTFWAPSRFTLYQTLSLNQRNWIGLSCLFQV